MELIVADASYDNVQLSRDAFIVKLRTELAHVDPEFTLHEANIGEGADWPVLVASFAGLFLLGDKIEKNLTAWISLARKVQSFVSDAIKVFGAVRVDVTGAKLLGIQHIVSVEQHGLNLLEHIAEQTVVLHSIAWNDPSRLEGAPDALYIHIFRVNDERLYVVGIKSRSELAFVQSFPTDYRLF